MPSIEAAACASALRGHRITVVESQPELSLLLDYYLSSQGHRVELIERGDIAERRLDASQPDLVVLDWATPGVSGVELLRRLRGKRGGERLPILLIATGRDPCDVEHAISRGADDVVTRPFSLTDISGRIAALLREPGQPSPVPSRSVGGMLLNPMARRLFGVFAEHCGTVLDRRCIHQSLWGHDVSFDAHAIDSHIARLRHILSTEWRVDPIIGLGGAGYRYDGP